MLHSFLLEEGEQSIKVYKDLFTASKASETYWNISIVAVAASMVFSFMPFLFGFCGVNVFQDLYSVK